MNVGERDELIFKILLVDKRDKKEKLFGIPITSVGFLGKEFDSLPTGFAINSLRTLPDKDIILLAKKIRIDKAPAGAKADVMLNGRGVSLKSLRAAPAALVNHTSRPGFEFACRQAGVSINKLDEIIDDYWTKRFAGIITEDTRNTDANCPFKAHKDYMKPILEYFLFNGTGSKLSIAPADYLIEFGNPFDEATYKKLTKSDAVNEVWDKLIFSLRAKKGMPKNYDPSTYKGPNSASIAKWVRYHSEDYRGALHIRATK